MNRYHLFFITITIFIISCSDSSIKKPNNVNADSIISDSNCFCTSKNILPISCDTIVLSNRNLIYWSWNCDSSFLTFENINGTKIVLEKFEKDMMEFSARTGKSYIEEYPDFLLIQHRWISGCCTPPDLLLLDKENLDTLRHFKSEDLLYFNKEVPVLYHFEGDHLKYLTALHLYKNQEVKIALPENKILKTIKDGMALLPADLFHNTTLVDSSYLLFYKYHEDDKWVEDSVQFDF